MEPTDRLASWKEIAAYLKRDVRTVQRWEAGEQLPVHRHRHHKRGSVYAYPAELDAWLNSRRATLLLLDSDADEIEAGRRPADRSRAAWPWAIGAGALIGLVLALWVMRQPDAPAVDTTVDAPRLFGEALREGGTLERIPLGGTAAYLALSPDGETIFASLCDVDNAGFEVVDVRTRAVTWSVRNLSDCAPLVVNSSGDRLFVPDDADIVVADIGGRTMRRIRTPASHVGDIALARDDRTLYVAAVYDGLLKVDTRSGEVITLSRIACPVRLALTPSADRLYVSYQCSGPGGAPGHDAIEVFDTRTDLSVGVIKNLPNVGSTIVVSPDGGQVWADGADACFSSYYDRAGCPSEGGSVVNVIRTSDHTHLRSLRVGPQEEFNMRLGFTPDGSRVVAGRTRTMVVSATMFKAVETSPLPLKSNVLFSPDRRFAYAILGDTASIAVLPIAGHEAPPSGLTARWTFDGVGTDSAGGNDFDEAAIDTFVPGRQGLAIGVIAASPLRLQTPSLLDIDRGQMTVSAWVRLDALGQTQPVIEHAATTDQGIFGWALEVNSNGRATVCLGWFAGQRCDPLNSGAVQGTTALQPSRWHHLTISRARGTLNLYLDGRLDGSGQVPDVVPVPNKIWLRLGSTEASAALMAGRLDEVEIYNRALTADEIFRRYK